LHDRIRPRVWIDKIRDWELLATLTATSFFRGGKFVRSWCTSSIR